MNENDTLYETIVKWAKNNKILVSIFILFIIVSALPIFVEGLTVIESFIFPEKIEKQETLLKISGVNYEVSHYLTNNNNTENLELEIKITLYNSNQSDCLGRVIPIHSKIIDNEASTVVGNGTGGLEEDSYVKPGDLKTFYSNAHMPLNQTGNYTIETTVEYLNVESGELEELYIIRDFYILPDNGKKLYPYILRFKNGWHIGTKIY